MKYKEGKQSENGGNIFINAWNIIIRWQSMTK